MNYVMCLMYNVGSKDVCRERLNNISTIYRNKKQASIWSRKRHGGYAGIEKGNAIDDSCEFELKLPSDSKPY